MSFLPGTVLVFSQVEDVVTHTFLQVLSSTGNAQQRIYQVLSLPNFYRELADCTVLVWPDFTSPARLATLICRGTRIELEEYPQVYRGAKLTAYASNSYYLNRLVGQ
jgi:hypothetical protein